MMHSLRFTRHAALATLCGLLLSGPATAAIDLVLEAVPEPCATRVLEVALYAVSDEPGVDQSLSAMAVILQWDPDVLKLEGNIDTGPYVWLVSDFLDDVGGLNDTWDDGDALYEAYARLGVPAYATPDGLLVTTFQLRKLLVGQPTDVTIAAGGPDEGYPLTVTVVYDGEVPGLAVTGTLTSVTLLPSAKGDINCDGHIDYDDIDPFVLAMTGEDAFHAVYPDCNWYNGDVNCDLTVNYDDIDPWVALLTQ